MDRPCRLWCGTIPSGVRAPLEEAEPMSKTTAFVVPLLFLASACQTSTGVKKVVDKPATLEFFVMSQCPYGVQVMSAVAPVVEQLGPNLDFKVSYIGDKKGDEFTSMHGPKEVTGDIVQLCAQKLAPQSFMKMIACQYKTPQGAHSVDTNWQDCAKEAGISSSSLKSCIEGSEGKGLLAASFDNSRQRGATGSPTMFLNGKPYQGGRKSRDFLRTVCDAYTGAKPQACTSIPPAPPVAAIFFSDKRCAECNIAPLEPRLKSELGGLTVKNVDYMTDEGKKLYADLRQKDASFRYLPAVLFDNSIEKDKEGYNSLSRYLRPLGEYRILAIGGKFDPTAEICDNKIDDDGNGKIDCQDPGCKDTMVCRPEKAKNLDLFVMSQCPYGNKAVTAMKEVLSTFPKDLSLGVHFIGDEQGTELNSMHGPAEVQEDLRQACVIKHYGRKHQFMNYLACRAADYRNPNWEACTGGTTGIEAATIKRCVDGEGKDLLKADFRLAHTLGIGASPTFLANNKYVFNGIDAETIKQNFCKYNSGLAGCSKTLSTDAKVQGSCGH
jgi:sulfur relay (sulfurtransferase) DsrF/TusC family protein